MRRAPLENGGEKGKKEKSVDFVQVYKYFFKKVYKYFFQKNIEKSGMIC